ncbi:MAG: sigma-54 dependent transcriptional regulator [Melioribacteraceae bacterium]|nr:sigma-54 dependent transcriptional regulator [Melioribacteraceae bacterium]MCF8265133.1 sigma-54 dependent transcriptional regulator [Melioribacteraceae bacterium]MCF8432024.1 sigma-54 dependent transcriptional regulator [Melioribacteraceae bacterium]
MKRKFEIQVFSDHKVDESILYLLGKFDIVNYEVISDERRIDFSYDLNIFFIEDVESKLVSSIIQSPIENYDTSRFLIVNDKPEIYSTLARIGFNNIYHFGSELIKFESDLSILFTQVNENINELNPVSTDEILIGESPSIKQISEIVEKVASNPEINVLILGETGTGKGLLAKFIHDKTFRKKGTPFIDVLMTAIPDALLESELFGYEKGAFTDAKTAKEGLFEIANGGTIFLDEIGEISPEFQAKLLRVIEKKEIRRIGGIEQIIVNSRIITATNQNLKYFVEKNKFRRDLYYRINTVTIELPPLRERGDDIIILADHFVNQYCREFNKFISGYDDEVKEFLMSYSWPGNIRELQHAIEKAVILENSPILRIENFDSDIKNVENPIKEETQNSDPSSHILMNINYSEVTLEGLEREYVLRVLSKLNGNKTLTAKYLNISRPRLNRIIN